jgi:hypothetical protein
MPTHKYRLTLERAEARPEDPGREALALEFESHDDIFEILSRTREQEPLSEADRRELTVGLKLFSDVMLRNRDLPMFRDLQPHFGAFMKALKGRSTR